eukprot:g83026.t1
MQVRKSCLGRLRLVRLTRASRLDGPGGPSCTAHTGLLRYVLHRQLQVALQMRQQQVVLWVHAKLFLRVQKKIVQGPENVKKVCLAGKIIITAQCGLLEDRTPPCQALKRILAALRLQVPILIDGDTDALLRT